MLSNRMKKILFVCTANEHRSKTAEELAKSYSGIKAKSAGVRELAQVKVNKQLLKWADLIVVMEDWHKEEITKRFPDICPRKRIVNFDVPDMYPYMSPELIMILKEKIKDLWSKTLNRKI